MPYNTDRADALALVEEAQEKMFEAIELLEQYCHLAHERHTEAYILDHLKIMTSADHGFLSRDANLGEVIDGLLHPEEDFEEPDEEPNDEYNAEAEWPEGWRYIEA